MRRFTTTITSRLRSNRRPTSIKDNSNTPSDIYNDEITSSIEQISSTLSSTSTSSIPSVELTDWFQGRAKTPKWMQSQLTSKNRSIGLFPEQPILKSTNQNLSLILQTLEENKGINIKSIDMFDKSEMTDYLVIATGKNAKHVYALADSVRQLFKKSYTPNAFMPDTLTIDGADTDWMTLDTGKVVIHCFSEEMRLQIDLEGLWEGFSDPMIKDARLGFVNSKETADRIIKDCRAGMDNQFKMALSRLEVGDLINEEEVKDAMK